MLRVTSSFYAPGETFVIDEAVISRLIVKIQFKRTFFMISNCLRINLVFSFRIFIFVKS